MARRYVTCEDDSRHALLLSFGVILVAELGDKSQLMALAFATRYRALPVLAGITGLPPSYTPSPWSSA